MSLPVGSDLRSDMFSISVLEGQEEGKEDESGRRKDKMLLRFAALGWTLIYFDASTTFSFSSVPKIYFDQKESENEVRIPSNSSFSRRTSSEVVSQYTSFGIGCSTRP